MMKKKMKMLGVSKKRRVGWCSSFYRIKASGNGLDASITEGTLLLTCFQRGVLTVKGFYEHNNNVSIAPMQLYCITCLRQQAFAFLSSSSISLFLLSLASLS